MNNIRVAFRERDLLLGLLGAVILLGTILPSTAAYFPLQSFVGASIIGTGFVGTALYRHHSYRSRVTIYWRILQYLLGHPHARRSEIMRDLRLETGKFHKYMTRLKASGAVNDPGDDSFRTYSLTKEGSERVIGNQDAIEWLLKVDEAND